MTNETAQLVWNLCGLDPEEGMWGYDQEGFASYLRQMLDAESCIVSVATSTGIAEGDFTVASSSGYPTARASLSKLYEQIPTTQKAEKVEK